MVLIIVTSRDDDHEDEHSDDHDDEGGDDHDNEGVDEEDDAGIAGDHEDLCGSRMSLLSSVSSSSLAMQTSEHYSAITLGMHMREAYDHDKKYSIMSVCFNCRMKQFVIADAKGLSVWKQDIIQRKVYRAYSFRKYEYKVIRSIVYTQKYNCYFALTKDFSLAVFNKDFEETCSVSADLQSVLFMLFNPYQDELITGGVGGIKIWWFHQAATEMLKEIKPLANYRLTLRTSLKIADGSWVKHVELEPILRHLYCCTETDLYAYDFDGKPLFHFKKAHTMTITGCKYSVSAKMLITCSADTEVKAWSLVGGLVATLRGHSRAVTGLLIHPSTSLLVVTASLDGSIRLWSLETMELLYSIVVSTHGVRWIGLAEDNLLYIATERSISKWVFNQFYSFWGVARNRISDLRLVSMPRKTGRLLALGEDSSVRVFCQKTQKNLSTVLPPPSLSPLQSILSMTYNRDCSVVYLLLTPQELWVYTTRTDPACRVATWNIHHIQASYKPPPVDTSLKLSSRTEKYRRASDHRNKEHGSSTDLPAACCSVSTLHSPVTMWTEAGLVSPLSQTFLLLGLEDGRILFMNPVKNGLIHMHFKAAKEPVLSMVHDAHNNCLITQCRLKELMSFQIWTLPGLELDSEVFCELDVLHFARLGGVLFTGHESGRVERHVLEHAEDPGPYRPRVIPMYEDVVDATRRPEHSEAITAMDVCSNRAIVCTASFDGAVKIWDSGKLLVREISMDESLGSVCFLDQSGNLLLSFKNHLFVIYHNRVCDGMPFLDDDVDQDESFDADSEVYEDPAVLHEGMTQYTDAIDLHSYLMPFHLNFGQYFAEGHKQVHETAVVEIKADDAMSVRSGAPTDMYHSEPGSPASLSMVDLTLASDITAFDLECQLNAGAKGSHKGDTKPENRFAFPICGPSPNQSPRTSLHVASPAPAYETPTSLIGSEDEDVSEGVSGIETSEDQSARSGDKDDKAETVRKKFRRKKSKVRRKGLSGVPTMANSVARASWKVNKDYESQIQLEMAKRDSDPKKGLLTAEEFEQYMITVDKSKKPEDGTVFIYKTGSVLRQDVKAGEKVDVLQGYKPKYGLSNVVIDDVTLAKQKALARVTTPPPPESVKTDVVLPQETVIEDTDQVPKTKRRTKVIQKKVSGKKLPPRLQTHQEKPDQGHQDVAERQTSVSTDDAKTMIVPKTPSSLTRVVLTSESTKTPAQRNIRHGPPQPLSLDPLRAPIKDDTVSGSFQPGEVSPALVSHRVSSVASDQLSSMMSDQESGIAMSGGSPHPESVYQDSVSPVPSSPLPRGATPVTSQVGQDIAHAEASKMQPRTAAHFVVKRTKIVAPTIPRTKSILMDEPPTSSSADDSVPDAKPHIPVYQAVLSAADVQPSAMTTQKQYHAPYHPRLSSDVSQDKARADQHSEQSQALTTEETWTTGMRIDDHLQADRQQRDYPECHDKLDKSSYDQLHDKMSYDQLHDNGSYDQLHDKISYDKLHDKNSYNQVLATAESNQKHYIEDLASSSGSRPTSGVRQRIKTPVSRPQSRSHRLPPPEITSSSVTTADAATVTKHLHLVLPSSENIVDNIIDQVMQVPAVTIRPKTSQVRITLDGDVPRHSQEAMKRRHSTGVSEAFSRDTMYDINWQEKRIERHYAVKFQKEMRVKSAQQKRDKLNDQWSERCRNLLGHRNCAPPYTAESDEVSPEIDVYDLIERLNSERKPMPPSRTRRPQTAPLTLYGMDKTELNKGLPFRCQMTTQNKGRHGPQSQSEPEIDVREFDPRNPQAKRRPMSSRSIPNKCSRYVLVTKKRGPGSDMIPTPLEGDLLAKRFPTYHQRLIQHEINTRHEETMGVVVYAPSIHISHIL